MTDLLARISELAGPAVARAIQAEFGAARCDVPAISPCAVDNALAARVSLRLPPRLPLARSAAALTDWLAAADRLGLQAQAVELNTAGLGQALIDALRERLATQGLADIRVKPLAR
ncbi:hypothetical protein [Vandammella animalimorsus]|uniref:Uncharacterized protein n=1 Tax=Vandammella animalimorsus TaxID=2029117 RepID=A0A2A2B154_9BURK|nr:hypothetical protein [Vandammella animalimorsus]PAT43801.1 hypothetical protein CK621_02905 [Vandammella animalimorsus]